MTGLSGLELFGLFIFAAGIFLWIQVFEFYCRKFGGDRLEPVQCPFCETTVHGQFCHFCGLRVFRGGTPNPDQVTLKDIIREHQHGKD